jgi:hypothetical protein
MSNPTTKQFTFIQGEHEHIGVVTYDVGVSIDVFDNPGDMPDSMLDAMYETMTVDKFLSTPDKSTVTLGD